MVLSPVKNDIVIEVCDLAWVFLKIYYPHIFERFSKAGHRGLRNEQSTGLGLSIARQIVEHHYGIIEVHSAKQRGSTFKIAISQVVSS